ncbi:FAD-dependent monooxygenase [Fodinicola feengrottensis]|uniref:FAD-dependent monooxygenase n=1 Tax=Fodinicola feengrottensis TaxID=435914 RepID=UPI00244118F7|nr:FAD-dependent monooxygenase [Fodinicola feengrottensis]
MLLAGDAAHVHSPIGAQGMNTGIGDAFNLGWKIAAVVHGTAPAWLLDTYESERHPVGEKILKFTDRLIRMTLIRSKAALGMIQGAMAMVAKNDALISKPRNLFAGISIAYEPHGQHPHPLAGKRAPDIEVGGHRLYEALRGGRFVLVDSTVDGAAARTADRRWGDRVQTLAGRIDSTKKLPALMLVRPDAYVAWASDSVESGSVAAVLDEWCGAPRAEKVSP